MDSGLTTGGDTSPTEENGDPDNECISLCVMPQVQPQGFEVYMQDRLPYQAVLYLLACGFDTEASFLSLNDSGGDQDSFKLIENVLRTDSHILKENIVDARSMYGMYYDCPESFKILPGHKSVIRKFVRDLQNEIEESKKNFTQSRKHRKRKMLQAPSRLSLHTQSQNYKKRVISTTSAKQNPCAGPEVHQIPTYVEELNKTMELFFSKNGELGKFNIEKERHYTIEISPSTSDKRKVDCFVTCVTCGTTLNLPFANLKFQPANFYRHLKSCFLNVNRLGKRKTKQFNNSSIVQKVSKQVTIYREGQKSESDNGDHSEDNLKGSNTDKSEKDHTYITYIVEPGHTWGNTPGSSTGPDSPSDNDAAPVECSVSISCDDSNT